MAVSNNKAGLAQDIAQTCDDMRLVLAKARDIWDRYNDTGVQQEVEALGEGETVPGTPFDKETITNATYALAQFVAWMDGGYRVNVNKAAALVEDGT